MPSILELKQNLLKTFFKGVYESRERPNTISPVMIFKINYFA